MSFATSENRGNKKEQTRTGGGLSSRRGQKCSREINWEDQVKSKME